MDKSELTRIYCARPQNFSWFLGAGASSSAGLPTANAILWDLKRQYYCSQENQEILRHDIENDAIQTRIQTFMESRGFPSQFDDNEYSTYFEKIFGNSKERQRAYLKKILSEDHVSLSVGSRVIGALMLSEHIRTIFTTNFDSVLEKAYAELGCLSLSPFHLEGARSSIHALNNEEFPIYVKLHGDFRYENLKNLASDLQGQNQDLSQCLINASNRSGLIVVGYSGRDTSIMNLFRRTLDSENPFPHGLFWTGIEKKPMKPQISELLELARSKDVNAEYVMIETFDALMLRLWRNIEDKPSHMDAQVRKTAVSQVSISLPPHGNSSPIIRMNALPVLSTPQKCFKLSLRSPMTWRQLWEIQRLNPGKLIFTKMHSEIWCWGMKKHIKQVFSDNLISMTSNEIPLIFSDDTHLIIRRFFRDAICEAFIHNKPLISRVTRSKKAFLIVDESPNDNGVLSPLINTIGGPIFGYVPNVPVDDQHPNSKPVQWAEAVQVSLDIKNETLWILLNPCIWIWPPRARKLSVDFIQSRCRNRYNHTFNDILNAWVKIILGTDAKNMTVKISAYNEGSAVENPSFCVGSRTAYSKKTT